MSSHVATSCTRGGIVSFSIVASHVRVLRPMHFMIGAGDVGKQQDSRVRLACKTLGTKALAGLKRDKHLPDFEQSRTRRESCFAAF